MCVCVCVCIPAGNAVLYVEITFGTSEIFENLNSV